MALHPSGSAPKEVELVVIETNRFSLVIKGKPYHERYEGLKQYRQIDIHDVMQFDAKGEGLQKVLVYDVDEETLVPFHRHRPIFFENSVYQVILSPKEEEELFFYHEHPFLRKAVSRVNIGTSYILMGNLQFQNEIGLSNLEIRSSKGTLLTLTIEVFPSKLDYKRDYLKLLDEVNDEIYNLAYHFLKKTYMGAQIKLDGNPSQAEFFRIISVHFVGFFKAIERIEQQPHHKLETKYEKVRGDKLKRVDSRGRSYLRKRSHLFVEVANGITVNDRTVMPQKGLNSKKELTYDTLENRYVKWMMVRLTEKLESLHNTLTKKNRYDVKPDEELIERVQKMIHKLNGKSKNMFWQSIGGLNRSVMSLVLQMAPGYRDAFQIFLTVSKGLALQGKLYQMSVKDVAELYECWTFLKLGQILRRKYEQVSQDVVKVNRDGLFVTLDTNQSAKRVFLHPVTKERIELTYQKTERNPTTTQKPDSVLSIAKKGKGYTFDYVFDAKYRIDFAVEDSYYGKRYHSPGPLEDDINTMHRYRDSIVARQKGPYERTAYGAYVLFPFDREDTYKDHHFYKSIEEVNIGGLPFLPSATEIVEQFVERLIEKSPEELQEEGILPRGTKEEWVSSLEEKVLIGVVSDEDQYKASFQSSTYEMDKDKLRKGWQEAVYVALYVSKDVADVANGVSYYGKVKEVSVEEYGRVKFTVESWRKLEAVIRPVNYGIAGYAMTTLTNLKEATELPELFMKSRTEMQVWRMIRRVSDWIKVELDSNLLNNATGVKSYQLKDLEIQFDVSEQNVHVVNASGKIETMSYEDFQANPSRVFKLITSGLVGS